MAERPLNILILCTGNSARSILAEALLNREGRGRVRAFSAGSKPKGVPNPIGIGLLNDKGFDTAGLRSKSWDEFAGADAPQMDVVITVCDSAAGETCPFWPGGPVKAHWGIPDPADDHGSPDRNRAAFELAFQRLAARCAAFLALDLSTISRVDLTARLAEIGRLEGATVMSKTTA